jgi:N-acetylmuramic acid 6-phosphate etherase
MSEELGDLVTESRRDDLDDLDLLGTAELVTLMNEEDARVPAAVEKAGGAIAGAIEAIVERLRRGGRLLYIGAGTSGRIGAMDAAECPPTFNTPPEMVQAIVAGGDTALAGAKEDAEDDDAAGGAAIDSIAAGADDAVVGIAASGRTPFVLGALRRARERGALTVGISCNPDAALSKVVEHPIEVVAGPEFISGSTRLKAGTAQKLVLNMISTIAMVRLGKTYGNLMVDVKATNEKLRARARRIVAQATGAGGTAVEAALEDAGGDVKIAIVMLKRGLDPESAAAVLRDNGGELRPALLDTDRSAN